MTKRTIIDCNSCPQEIEKDHHFELKSMTVNINGNPVQLVDQGRDSYPDFCGVPCLSKWVYERLSNHLLVRPERREDQVKSFTSTSEDGKGDE
jgi:hypothetical protein